MRKKGEMLLWLLGLTLTSFGQYQDELILTSGDTLPCKITLVNDHNIFYEYKPGKKIISTYTSKEKIRSYVFGRNGDALVIASSSRDTLVNNAQNNQIIIRNNRYYHQGERIGIQELKSFLYTCPSSRMRFIKGRSLMYISIPFQTLGGYFIGYGLGAELFPSYVNGYFYMVLGGIIAAPGIICSASYYRKVAEAIELYNA